MAWGVEELKKYISELRYLSHGEYDGEYDPLIYNGNGLQADWAIDDPTAFGYIYNKPTALTNYRHSNPLIDSDAYQYNYMEEIDPNQHIPLYSYDVNS
jgi:hypothetical protein